ncbi:MAG TPA: energy-coupling factor transporter transmembrane component T [Caldisericia bacterium]|nr:energy-coupling factor transporter transmembrane component T [Caldisericia bacterium]HPF49311.1 energy-coupling factor transporter transmembrane component T [Caldisericia bacterium]HPI84009.1 energy-coupling factor transporter transmembrane component T [Caldisericia bacterium]HPQ93267.1 energy-coupling factor transporter transmembrane component T [Caldisericia bacterium]HRV75351.1 energy-coupling factor transporter transmembrane component T [Caldisericia bacterium]
MAISNLIVIGQYIPGDTFIHRMDSRIKLFIAMIMLVFIFMVGTLEALLIMFGLVLLVSFVAKVPFVHLLRGLRPILFLIVLTVLIQLFVTQGEPLIEFWGLSITKEGLIYSGKIILRLITLVSVSIILTFATSPLELTFALESFMKPFKVIGFPASEVALMMSIALRFIPTLLSEADKIVKAQSSRGADFTSGGLIARAKAFVPVLIPLFVSAFRRAEELAQAMESRCFVTGGKRGRLHIAKIRPTDWLALTTTLVCLVALYWYASI